MRELFLPPAARPRNRTLERRCLAAVQASAYSTLENDDDPRLPIAALVVHIGLGMVSNVIFLAAFQLRVDWFIEPPSSSPADEVLRWAAATDPIRAQDRA